MEENQIIIEAFANINEQLTADEMYLNGDEEFYNLKKEIRKGEKNTQRGAR